MNISGHGKKDQYYRFGEDFLIWLIAAKQTTGAHLIGGVISTKESGR